jgi:hypothetical protein
MDGYDAATFSPPAPVASVTFVHPETGHVATDVMMLIDTGSDETLVPANVCAALGAEAITTLIQVELVDGARTELQAVRLQMKWDRYTFNGDFLVTKTKFGIIGRNALNRIRIRFDGPAQTWSFD